MRKQFVKMALITVPAGLAVAVIGIVVFSAYMRSIGVEPPFWILWYSVPAGVVAGLGLSWAAVANKRFNLTRSTSHRDAGE